MAASNAQQNSEESVSVFVRVRPLTQSEKQQGSVVLPGLRTTSTNQSEKNVSPYEQAGTSIEGFAGVMGQDALNQEVFERCFAPQLQIVLRGGAASLFCYGYTGSGKTHTVIGYGEERGLYFLAAEHLLQKLRDSNDKVHDGDIFLRATACEMYNDEVYDLLGPTKRSCTLRMDEAGQLHVVGPSTSLPLDESENGLCHQLVPAEFQPKCMHATLVTRSVDLRSASIHRPEDLQEISSTCVQHRAVGSSTEHATSSRSHALLRMEVVNHAVLEAMDCLEKAQAEIPARRNALDNIAKTSFHVLYEGSARVLHPPGCLDSNGLVNDSVQSYPMVEGEAKSDYIKLIGYEDVGAKTVADWSAHFGVPALVVGYKFNRRDFGEPGKWEEIEAAFQEKKKELTELLVHSQAKVDRAASNLNEIKSQGPAALGGSMLLVDLAGADYDHRSGQQQKESAAINKSLLALKECFRSLAKASSAKPKFRDSKLTRLLEDSLAPATSSSRRNRESVSVMLVNVSPSKHLERMTLNTLRYGQLFASANEVAHSSRSSSRLNVTSAKSKAVCLASKPDLCDPKIKEELLSIYRKHCPEKSDHDVEVILRRFAGREVELLGKVQEKYVLAAR